MVHRNWQLAEEKFFIYIYIHYTHSRPLYLYFSRVHRPLYIYIYICTVSIISTAATRPRGAFLTLYNIYYYMYIYKIFSNYNFRRACLIRKSRFACSGKSKENMNAFPSFSFWYFLLKFDLTPPPPLPPSSSTALPTGVCYCFYTLLQRHIRALRYFSRHNCSH